MCRVSAARSPEVGIQVFPGDGLIGPADLGVAGQTADRQAGIQSALTTSVDSARDAQSGVNIDEEMTHLIAYQHAYQAAARVLNTVDSALDTLINHTGN